MAYIRSKVVGEEMYYLLLDEINAKLLSKDIATEFAGRGDEIHMYPLSFKDCYHKRYCAALL